MFTHGKREDEEGFGLHLNERPSAKGLLETRFIKGSFVGLKTETVLFTFFNFFFEPSKT